MNERTMEKQTATNMKWYIVRAQGNRERSVSEKLIKESENGDLIGKIGRVIVPMEKSFFMKDGKKIMREKVMYPSYIFVETNAVGELKQFIKDCKGASGFLTNRAGDVESLKNSEVDKMLGNHKESQEKEIDTVLVPGEEVKVLDGPFAGFFGKVDSINNQKVKVSVSIFGRPTILELNIHQIDKKSEY